MKMSLHFHVTHHFKLQIEEKVQVYCVFDYFLFNFVSTSEVERLCVWRENSQTHN